MLVIRLQRTGRENLPSYRIVVAEKARPVKGKFTEVLGHYLPARNPEVFECDSDRFTQWVAKGAKPSNTVARLLAKHGYKGLEKYFETYTKKRSKKAPPEAPAAPAAAAPAAEPAKEEPAAESAA